MAKCGVEGGEPRARLGDTLLEELEGGLSPPPEERRALCRLRVAQHGCGIAGKDLDSPESRGAAVRSHLTLLTALLLQLTPGWPSVTSGLHGLRPDLMRLHRFDGQGPHSMAVCPTSARCRNNAPEQLLPFVQGIHHHA